MPSNIKNLSQKRAKFAYDTVLALKGESWAGEFKSHVKDVPMMIKTNGLAAAYAFVFSKSKKPDYKKIADVTCSWLTIEQPIISLADDEELYRKLTELESQQYRMVIREVLALFTWLKRFSDGMISN